jgi:hypothetical protein
MDQFFANLPCFTDFEQVSDPAVYHRAPENYWLVITDVQGSTQAIEQGRYKEVNLAGASSIAAVTNSCPMRIPFIFGGDGATFLIPAEVLEAVKESLIRTQTFVKSSFGLHPTRGL